MEARRTSESNGYAVSAQAFAIALDGLLTAKPAAIAVAVSGGADSMALVLLAAQWAKMRGVKLTALTVDHRLRPESESEAQTVAQWMRDSGIAHEILTWDEGRAVRHLTRSAQDAARDARYNLLTDWCRAHDCKHLLLAHHTDDQVETFLIRLARGSGLQGLGGMDALSQVRGVAVLRPLLAFSKADLIETCGAACQPWIEDPSNQSEKYARTRFRRARAVLEAEGLTQSRMLATVAHLQRARAAVTQSVRALERQACQWSAYGTASISRPLLLGAPEEISLRLLSDVLRRAGGQIYGPRFDGLERLYKKLQTPDMKPVTLHGCWVAVSNETVSVIREPAAIGATKALPAMGSVVWDGRFEIVCRDVSGLRVRAYRPEDKAFWRGQGGGGAFADVSARIRRGLPVLADDHGPAAMPHLGLWRPDAEALRADVTIRFLGGEETESPDL